MNIRSSAVMLCALLGAPTLAHAAFYLQGDGYAQGAESFTLTAPGTVAVNPVGAGGFVGKAGATNPPTTPMFFWCVELSQTFSFGTVYSDYSINPFGNTLLSQLFTEVGGSAAILGGSPSPAKTVLSAAFQLAVWEIMFEGGSYGGLNVTSGNFSAVGDSGTLAQANSWLSALTAGSPATTALFLLQSPEHQNFITDTPVPPLLLVPEPASLPLLVLGLLAVMVAVRRRVQRAR